MFFFGHARKKKDLFVRLIVFYSILGLNFLKTNKLINKEKLKIEDI